MLITELCIIMVYKVNNKEVKEIIHKHLNPLSRPH